MLMLFVLLVYEIIRYIAMAMQQVIVDISQRNVSFDSTSLVSMVRPHIIGLPRGDNHVKLRQ
jgi:hypothetical protein